MNVYYLIDFFKMNTHSRPANYIFMNGNIFGIFFFSIYNNVGVKYYNGERIVVLIGIYSIFISAFVWIITEIFCNKYLILGHSFWHIGVSYGVNNIIMYMNVYYNEKKCLV